MSEKNRNTEKLYNQTAHRWSRREPNSLSDFTARPRVFELCGDVKGKSLIDLGAGEGYCARVLADKGAARIQGIELSEAMVELAKSQQQEGSEIIQYDCGNVVNLPYESGCFDLALGVFVYNYLSIDETRRSFSEVFRVLRDQGEFVFSVPHPAFPFIRRAHEPPFYFDVEGRGYFSSRDHKCSGEIHCRDGTVLGVQMVPKSLQDYFSALRSAGFNRMPEVQEYGVTDEMIALDKAFFLPIKDIPLHLAFKIRK